MIYQYLSEELNYYVQMFGDCNKSFFNVYNKQRQIHKDAFSMIISFIQIWSLSVFKKKVNIYIKDPFKSKLIFSVIEWIVL